MQVRSRNFRLPYALLPSVFMRLVSNYTSAVGSQLYRVTAVVMLFPMQSSKFVGTDLHTKSQDGSNCVQ